MMLLVPNYTTKKGVDVKTYPNISDGILFYGNFKASSGTELPINDIYSIEDIAYIETWYRPDIKSDCRVALPLSGAIYEVFGEPENIDLRNQYLKFRVRRYKGGV